MMNMHCRASAAWSERERRPAFFSVESMGPRDNPEATRNTIEQKNTLKLPTNAKEAKEYAEHSIDDAAKVLKEKVAPALTRALSRVGQALNPEVLKYLPPEKRQELEQMKGQLEMALAQLQAGGVLHYLRLKIEHREGEERTKQLPGGAVRRDKLVGASYGHIEGGSVAMDGDAPDVLVGKDTATFNRVFVFKQLKSDGSVNELKYGVGFANVQDAINAYKGSYPEIDPQNIPQPTEMTLPEFQQQFGVGQLAS